MTSRLPDETTIRRYLLGQLDDNSELAESLDEQMLTDAGLSEMVEVVEDEIIEEYLEGTLHPAEKRAVENHFLRPPQRQAKMQTARLLYRHFQPASREPEAVSRIPGKPSTNVVRISYLRAHLRTYMEVAAGVVFAASIFYMAWSHRESQLQVRHGNQELLQEREHSAALSQQLQDLAGLQQPATIMWSLFDPTLFRGDAKLPELKIGAATKTVQFEISLPAGSSGAYDVRLERGGSTLWSKPHVPAYTSPDGSLLILDVPARDLSSNEYRLVLSRQPDHGREIGYSFRTETIK